MHSIDESLAAQYLEGGSVLVDSLLSLLPARSIQPAPQVLPPHQQTWILFQMSGQCLPMMKILEILIRRKFPNWPLLQGNIPNYLNVRVVGSAGLKLGLSFVSGTNEDILVIPKQRHVWHLDVLPPPPYLGQLAARDAAGKCRRMQDRLLLLEFSENSRR